MSQNNIRQSHQILKHPQHCTTAEESSFALSYFQNKKHLFDTKCAINIPQCFSEAVSLICGK